MPPIATVASLLTLALILAALLGSLAVIVYLHFSLGPVLPQNSGVCEGEEEEGAFDDYLEELEREDQMFDPTVS